MKGQHSSLIQLRQNTLKRTLVYILIGIAIAAVLIPCSIVGAMELNVSDDANVKKTTIDTMTFETCGKGQVPTTIDASSFILNVTDTASKPHMEVDANDTNFGVIGSHTLFSTRLKTGGKSTPDNKLELDVKEDGILHICARTASNSATDRNIVVTSSSGTEIINHVLLESEAVEEKYEEGGKIKTRKIYPVLSANVGAGTYSVTYPENAINIYSFALEHEGSSGVTASFKGGEGAEGTAPSDITVDPNTQITLPNIPFYQPGSNGTVGKHATVWSDGETTYAPGSKYTMGDSNVEFKASGWNYHVLEEHPRIEPTCTTDGNTQYWKCLTCGMCFTDAIASQFIEEEDTILPKTGHDLEHHSSKEATCTVDGNIEYWYCKNCGKYFSDADAQNEITQEQTVIPHTGHLLTYQVDGDKITAQCMKCGTTVTATIQAPQITIYTGEALDCSIKNKQNFEELTGHTLVLTYQKDGEYVDHPVDAGNYSAFMAVSGLIAQCDFTIDKASQNIATPFIQTISYDYITISPIGPGYGDTSYAISETKAAPASGWQSGTTFNSLKDNTKYYIYSKYAGDDNHDEAICATPAEATTMSYQTAFENFKKEQIEALDYVDKEGDSAAVKTIIANAKIELNALEYNASLSPEENYEVIQNIFDRTLLDIDVQRTQEFEDLKAEKVQELENMKQEGDSANAEKIINDTIKNLNDIKYDTNKTPLANKQIVISSVTEAENNVYNDRLDIFEANKKASIALLEGLKDPSDSPETTKTINDKIDELNSLTYDLAKSPKENKELIDTPTNEIKKALEETRTPEFESFKSEKIAEIRKFVQYEYTNDVEALMSSEKNDSDTEKAIAAEAINKINNTNFDNELNLANNKKVIQDIVDQFKSDVEKQRADDEKKKQEESQEASSTENVSAQTGDMTYVVVSCLVLCSLGTCALVIRKRREF
ncbi:MAG: hypothetical protein Q4E88_02330 [Coriobacteriia bacterium]|nr:hypothetical protein [Coriobacteriia bacterium]